MIPKLPRPAATRANARSSSKVLRARPAPGARLPHPSWRGAIEPASANGVAVVRSAGDFWSRLGL